MIRIICIGKLKEKFLVDGVDEYKKRIEGFQKLQILELKAVSYTHLRAHET